MTDIKHLLLVEDEVLIALSEKMNLEAMGYRVTEVYNGEDAVAFIREEKEKIDLILMDIDLGKGMDGTEAAQHILSKREIPVLFLSSHVEPEIIEKTEKITSYGYVVKQSAITVLDASIKMAFKLFDAKLAEKKKEDALLQSESHLRTLINTLPDLVWLKTPDGRYLNCNATFKVFFDIEALDIEGRTDYDLTDKITADHFIADDRRALNSESPIVREERVVSPRDGIEHILETIKTSMKDENGDVTGVLGIARDISDRKKNEAALRESYERLEEFDKYTTEGIYRVDFTKPVSINQPREDLIEAVNSYAVVGDVNDILARMYHLTPADMIGRSALDFAPDYGRRIAMILEHSDYVVKEVETEDVNSKGGSIYLLENFRGIVKDGMLLNLWGSQKDITELKRYQKEIAAQLAEKELLLKEVHHRIKNNMLSLETLTALQVTEDTSAEVRTQIQELLGRIQSIRVLYDNLLVSGEYERSSVLNYLNTLIDSIKDVFPDRAHVTIVRDIAELPLDSKLLFYLGIIINELITNSFKYAFKNKADECRISVVLKAEDDRLLLTVEDNGAGSENSGSRKEPSGFGLMIVDMVSRQLNGKFTLERNGGYKCRLEFPVS